MAQRLNVARFEVSVATQMQDVAQVQQVVLAQVVPTCCVIVNVQNGVAHVAAITPQGLCNRLFNSLTATRRRVGVPPFMRAAVTRATGHARAARRAASPLLLIA